MNLPSRTLRFAGSLVAVPRAFDLHTLQAHVIKHPLGMGALMDVERRRVDRVWNREGWDRLDPAVVTAEQRQILVGRIAKLQLAGATCRVPRLENERYAGEVPAGWNACQRPPGEPSHYQCPSNLASACAAVTREVAGAYVRVIEETLAMVADPAGEVVGRAELHKRVMQRRADLTGLAVLTVGFSRGAAPAGIVRVNRADGVRVEMWRDADDRLIWRTAYREVAATPATLLSFLLEGAALAANQSHPLSAQCIVPRLWWQSMEERRS